jgi:feruloyl esterase
MPSDGVQVLPTRCSLRSRRRLSGVSGCPRPQWLGISSRRILRRSIIAKDDHHTRSTLYCRPDRGFRCHSAEDVLLDYGYRAIKVTTDDSKAIIAALMGDNPRLSYFVGCSDGGREAFKEAQRYPDDFDGIIVGSPVNDQIGEFGSSYLYDMEVTLNGPQTSGVPDAYIPTSQLPMFTNAALAQCAGKDGGLPTDTFLSDPRQCLFDLKVVECKGGQSPPACLTHTQVEAARKIYFGPHNQRGELLFPGYEPGGEAISGDWGLWISGTSSAPVPMGGGAQGSLGYGFTCDLFLGVTTCNYLSVNVDEQDAVTRRTLQPILSSVDPDLRPFKQHGGKMIQYAG